MININIDLFKAILAIINRKKFKEEIKMEYCMQRAARIINEWKAYNNIGEGDFQRLGPLMRFLAYNDPQRYLLPQDMIDLDLLYAHAWVMMNVKDQYDQENREMGRG